jgi:hypothetical protein
VAVQMAVQVAVRVAVQVAALLAALWDALWDADRYSDQLMDAETASITKVAWSSDRAIFLWGMSVTALAALGGDTALGVACLGLPLSPVRCGMHTRIGLLVTAIAAFILGPTSLIFAVPLAIALSDSKTTAACGLMALTAVMLLGHQFESVPSVSWLLVHPGSGSFVITSALAIAATFGPRIGWRAVVALFVGGLLTLYFIEAGAGRWIEPAVFTSPIFRILAVLLPVASAFLFLKTRYEKQRDWRLLTISAAIGATVAFILPIKPISSVVFDEAHGKWETVEAPFGPNDFGRAVNYTYGLLFKYAERVAGEALVFNAEIDQLPSHKALFVIKMPVQPFSETFAERLDIWIRGGGRLLVVADHTDLYDTTQNLNKFLSQRFGLKLNSHAVYDATGMPTVLKTERFASLIGRVDAHGQPIAWQTGTSLAKMPLNTVRLATYGPSFSEPGDYSRPNRFGPFAPRISLRFSDHLAVAAFGIDHGAIAVMLDSTPWSNFSLFKAPYRHMFRGIIHALERPLSLQAWGWSGLFLGLVAILSIFFRHPIIFSAGSLVLGLAVGSAFQVGKVSAAPPAEGRDFSLRVVSGDSARLEFLKQLVGPGERNFTRVLSAMAKYNFDPLATVPGGEIPNLSHAKRWLLIQPEAHQLPTFEEIITHLRRGGDLTAIFSPDQASDASVRAWLASLGLYARKTVGLAVSEDAQVGFLNRRGAALLRDTRAMTNALPTSLFKDRETDPLMQSYTVRPTVFPRTNGILNISFSADQFSDDALGEIWEGIQPSSLGRHRERQLATVLEGKDFLPPFPKDLITPSIVLPNVILPAFALLNNGKTVLRGKFDQTDNNGPHSPSENPVGYLANLQRRAIAFINEECPKSGITTGCNKRLLGADALEWMVSWVAGDNDRILAVELLHEKRFSGLGSTINVIFGQ